MVNSVTINAFYILWIFPFSHKPSAEQNQQRYCPLWAAQNSSSSLRGNARCASTSVLNAAAPSASVLDWSATAGHTALNPSTHRVLHHRRQRRIIYNDPHNPEMLASTWRTNTTIYPRQWQHYTAAPVRANQHGIAIRPFYSQNTVFRCLLRKPIYIAETSLAEAWCEAVAPLYGILCTRLGSIGHHRNVEINQHRRKRMNCP